MKRLPTYEGQARFMLQWVATRQAKWSCQTPDYYDPIYFNINAFGVGTCILGIGNIYCFCASKCAFPQGTDRPARVILKTSFRHRHLHYVVASQNPFPHKRARNLEERNWRRTKLHAAHLIRFNRFR